MVGFGYRNPSRPIASTNIGLHTTQSLVLVAIMMIKASNTNTQDLFGFHVSLRDRLLLVSSAYESSNATGINGDQTNNDATLSGAAYLFAKVGTQWSQRAYIKASNTNKDDEFGFSLALSNDFFVIGAPFEASDARGVGGDEANNNMPFAGAAYIFE